MALGAAAAHATGAGLAQLGVIDRDMFAPAHLQTARIAGQIDRVAASALRLATDRAITALIRIGMGAGERERHCAAVTRTFELHGTTSTLRRLSRPMQRGNSVAIRRGIACGGWR